MPQPNSYDHNDITFINSAITQSAKYIVEQLTIKPHYTDYVYNKSMLEMVMYLADEAKIKIEAVEILDKKGEFFCWEIRNKGKSGRYKSKKWI